MRPSAVTDALLRSWIARRASDPRALAMLARIRGKHAGRSIAILGNGPSLARYTGQEAVAIAVNGAARLDAPYQYFLCGDLASPERDWFEASARHGATRLISAAVAPVDRTLFPDPADRDALIRERDGMRALPFDPYAVSFRFSPSRIPAPPHLWFRYERLPLGLFHEVPFTTATERLFAGATIAGVALQFAVLMDAAQVRFYGCDLDNVSGSDYYFPSKVPGGTSTAVQRRNLDALVRRMRALGVDVAWGR